MGFPAHKGFIAAPLLGTLIFLSAIVFVAHVTQVDKVETAAIVSETYHNRIVNILEDYRSDLGVIFSVNVVRAIQRYLTSECWALFTLSNKPPERTGQQDNLNNLRAAAGFDKAMKNLDYDDLPFCNNQHNDPAAKCTAGKTVNTGDPDSYLCAENCNRQLDYYELRYQKCTQVSQIIKDGICPYNEVYGITAWIESTLGERTDPSNPNSPRTPYSFEGISFNVSNSLLVNQFISRLDCRFNDNGANGGKAFQMPLGGSGQMVGRTNGNSVCVGYTGKANPNDLYDPHNNYQECYCARETGCQTETSPGNGEFVDMPENSPGFSCANLDGDVATGDGITRCQELIGNPLFDCRNFAVPETEGANPNRCCDAFYYNKGNPSDANNGKCCTGELKGNTNGGCDAKDHVIPGCELGSFFINVNITANEALYKMVPRVMASDKTGNTIRGGALGQEAFKVHVKYPVYRYLDAALKFYAEIAYGTNESGSQYDFLDPALNTKKLEGKARNPNSITLFEESYYPKKRGQTSTGSTPIASVSPNQGFRGKQSYTLVTGKGATDQGTYEGVVEGVCFGGTAGGGCMCTPDEINSIKDSDDFRGVCTPSNPINVLNTLFEKTDDTNVDNAEKDYYDRFFDPASSTSVCRLVKNKQQGGFCEQWGTCDTEIWIKGYNLQTDSRFLLLCPSSTDIVTNPGIMQSQDLKRIKDAFYIASSDPNDQTGLKGFFGKASNANQPDVHYKYLDAVYWTLDFRDFDSESLVLPEAPNATKSESPQPHNRFCWYAHPFHFNTINPTG